MKRIAWRTGMVCLVLLFGTVAVSRVQSALAQAPGTFPPVDPTNWPIVNLAVTSAVGIGIAATNWTIRGIKQRETKREEKEQAREKQLQITTSAAQTAVDHATEASRAAALAVEKAGEVAKSQTASHRRLGGMMACLGRNLLAVDGNVRESDATVAENFRSVTDPLREMQLEHVANHPARPGMNPIVARIALRRSTFKDLETFKDEEYPS